MQEKLNMTELFKGYSDYTEEEYQRIWKQSIIAVDANILLNFYRYSENTRESLLKILKKLKDRLWIPYQVGKEFFTNKNTVMISSYNVYDNLISTIQKKFQDINDEIDKIKNNQFNCKEDIKKQLEEAKKKIETSLNSEKDAKKPKFEKNTIETAIIKLFNDCIGEPYSDEEYIEIKQEGLRRFQNKIPPGYKDSNKEENGDYYIFYSLIQHSKLENKDVIFITDDVKEDWFNELNGEKHGGRYELLNEFYKETGNLLMIYTSDGFVKAYNKNIEQKNVDEKIIDELRNVRNVEYINEHTRLGNKKLLQFYRNRLIHSDESVNKEHILDDIYNMINSLSPSDRLRYRRNLINIRHFMSDKDYTAIVDRRLIDLIEKLMIHYECDYDNDDYDSNTLLNEINNNYSKFIIELNHTRSRIRQNITYNRLYENVTRHLNIIYDLPDRHNYKYTLLISRLKKVLELLSKNDSESSSSKNDEIVSNLKHIIDYNNLNAS